MNIDELRRKIDVLDEQVLSLLAERARLAQVVGKAKGESNAAAFVPSRERQILERMNSLNPGPLPREAIRAIYEQIMAACRALESPLAAGYLGPEGTFSHLAASRKFGLGASLLPFSRVDEVFAAVEKGQTNFGVVPVENSIAGVERTTLDRFIVSGVKICGELYVEVEHHLLSTTALAEIKRVYSHPQPLEQCRGWLQANLPGVDLVEVSSTARAAQLAAAEPASAAIATELAASLYHLPAVASHLQDRPDNRTRFLIIGREDAQPSGKDKTSLMFSVSHRAGTLWRSLGVLERHGINMTMIESRPTKQTPWEYVFFVDVQGHSAEPPLASALEELTGQTLFLKVLGAYPEAE